MAKPDPELLPIQRPRCPHCATRMKLTDVVLGRDGFERRSFSCVKCDHKETNVIASDPLKSEAVGWLSGELGQAAIGRDTDG